MGLIAEFLLISQQRSSQDSSRAAAGAAAAATGSADAVAVVRLILDVDVTRRALIPSRPPPTHHLSTTAKVPTIRGRQRQVAHGLLID